jgi:C-terminal processing protease CtpA/Prc
MEMMMDQIILAAPTLENIILDISWNTGGNVGALYRIVGFITDQPFAVSGIDGDTGGMSTSHVLIEGVPSYAHLNWALLITPVSFSAANSLATIFMANDLGPIVGKTSGGGACSITPILLPNGTAFTMSSNNINAYRTGTGTEEDPFVYHNNEFGITPDFAIDINLIYNVETLLTVFN